MVRFIDKKPLCTTQLKNFCEIQGIGNDPIYMRFSSVDSIILRYIPEEYQHFLARPDYSPEDDAIVWFAPEWTDTPRRLNDLYGIEKEKYERIYESTFNCYNQLKSKIHGEALGILNAAIKFVDKKFIFCYDNKVVCVAWGMKLRDSIYDAKGSVVYNFSQTKGYSIIFDPGEGGDLAEPNDRIIRRKEKAELVTADIPKLIPKPGCRFLGSIPQVQGTIVTSDLIFHAQCRKDAIDPIAGPAVEEPQVVPTHTLRFLSDDNCQFEGQTEMKVEDGYQLSESDYPHVVPNNGYEFDCWDPFFVGPVHSDMKFHVRTRQKFFDVNFQPGRFGSLKGVSPIMVPAGSRLSQEHIPQVIANSGYLFSGWNVEPLNYTVSDNCTFTATYYHIPWWRRFFIWFDTFGCLKWLLLLLAFLLLSWLFSWIFPGCHSLRWNHWYHPVDVTDKSLYVMSESTDTIYIPKINDEQEYMQSYYTVADPSSIRDQVQNRGGNINAFMRFSIIWNQNQNDIVDLDAHAVQPDQKEIYYGSYRSKPTSMSGQLDVDDIRPNHTGVENIVWTDPSKMKDGTYTLFIRNYDGGDNHGAKAEVAFNGKLWHYTIDTPINKGEDIPIAQIKIYNNGHNVFVHHSKYLDSDERNNN